MLYIGNMVYPRELEDCEATREEMERLYGIVVKTTEDDKDDEADCEYAVEWLDIDTHKSAKFDHGLKYAWWEENELTTDQSDYAELVNQEIAPSYEMPESEQLDEDVDCLMEEIENSLQIYGENYWEEDDYGRDEDIKEEYRQEIFKRLIEKLKKEIE